MSLEIIQQVQLAFSRLMEQRKKATNLQAIVTAAANQLQLLEQVIQDFLLKRGLDAAVGVNLDIVGLIVGQDRAGRTDDDYRLRLRLRIVQNNSEGTPEDLLNIMRTLLAPLGAEFMENFPAEFAIAIIEPGNDIAAAEVKEAIQSGKIAGVNGDYISHTDGLPAFAFDGDGDPNKAGFGYTDSQRQPLQDLVDMRYSVWQDYLMSEGPTGDDTIYYHGLYLEAVAALAAFDAGPYGKFVDTYH